MKGARTRERHWRQLYPGQKVRLTGAGGDQYQGVVDARTDDGAFVWVLTVGSGRKLFHVDDGFDAAPES
ncbi:hypothetical protein [Arthrobacter sp. ISL-28]|uniref:hypothetical protein n=1 Tax=Arthrobacter sp. ISL-28 TaxID=2819108 RepID=UPI001BEAFAB3|nr:hypothetical protein [Arthrobacter sp. ISL-28]MBT2523468.1 hypothetical protein [Arthrobacter sp. ISL-28]